MLIQNLTKKNLQYGKSLREVVRVNQKIDTDKANISEPIIQQLLDAGCRVLVETKFEDQGKNKPLKNLNKTEPKEKPSALELARERKESLDKEREFLTQDDDLSIDLKNQGEEEKEILKEIFSDNAENSKEDKLETDLIKQNEVSKKKRGRPKKKVDNKNNE